MRKFISILACACLLALGCEKSSGSSNQRSYSTCPIQVASTSLDYGNQVEYTLSGINMSRYSAVTVCFRRVDAYGNVKSYDEIIDTQENPDTYHTYHTYKKLKTNEVGVKVRYLELTEKSSGNVTRYVNYK